MAINLAAGALLASIPAGLFLPLSKGGCFSLLSSHSLLLTTSKKTKPTLPNSNLSRSAVLDNQTADPRQYMAMAAIIACNILATPYIGSDD